MKFTGITKSIWCNAALSVMLVKHILILVILLTSPLGSAAPPSYHYTQTTRVSINVDLFLSSTCPHCHKADAFFRDLEKKLPWLLVHRYVINQDKTGLQRFYEHLQRQHSSNFSVPAIFFCDARWAGFADEQTTGKALLQALTYCHEKILDEGELSPATVTVLQKWGTASQLQIGATIAPSVFSLLPITALSDAINPCALFVVAAFLAVLWLFPTKKWQQFSIGMVFIIFLGLIHYLQQGHSGFYYQNVFKWRLAAIVAGVLLLFSVFRDYQKTRMQADTTIIPWVVATIFLVIGVHIYQQTCEFNLALVFAQWLTEQSISPGTRIVYQMMYQFFYLLPFVALLLFFLIAGRSGWMRRYHQWFKTVAYLILASIGIILLAFPTLLSNLWVSAIVLFGSIGVGWVRGRYE